jgi:AcrR family transcriptional regulator
MSRTVKEPEERKTEIMNAALELFMKQGFAETSVSRIVKKVGVAQGTFYNYFQSKKQILLEIIDRRFIDKLIQAIKPIVDNPELGALEKLERIARTELEVSLEQLPDIQKIKNSDLFRRTFSQTVMRYVPLVAEVVQQGVDEGLFDAPYPLQFCAAFHVSTFFFFHPGVFQWNKEEIETNIRALVTLMERGYGAKPGSFDFYFSILTIIQERLH